MSVELISHDIVVPKLVWTSRIIQNKKKVRLLDHGLEVWYNHSIQMVSPFRLAEDG